MQQINWTRVLSGGLLAGLVINASEFVLNGIVLKNDWAKAMQAMNKQPEFGGSQIATFNVIGFLIGLLGVWLYAAMRPRYGPGLKTASITALAVWMIGNFLPNLGFLVMDMFPTTLLVIATVWGLVETIVGIALGAWVYKEEPDTIGARTAAVSR